MPVTMEDAMPWIAARKHAVLITLRRDGRAQSSDVSYAVLDDAIWISLTATRAKTANMRRDPRIVVHITDSGTWSYLSLDGVADLGAVAAEKGDAACDDLVRYYREVAGTDHPDWDEYRQAMVDEQRQILRFTPQSVVGQING